MELHIQLQPLRRAPDVPECGYVEQSLPESTGRRVALPVHVLSEQSQVHPPGIDLRSRAELRVALHLPVQLLCAAPGDERLDLDGRLRGLVRTPPALRGRPELSLLQQH